MGKYYLGLDMGTNSVGWAVTDERYHLIRKKGKDLWGVRLFQEAETAASRRTSRTSRRRRQREVARIGCLKELFAEAIDEVDAGFYQRLEDSKFFEEDKREHQPFALFADTDFTDKEYYEKYPTIYHLRKELLYSTEPHDVRLVYLAVLNMFKHRGHFLNSALDESEGHAESLPELYGKLCYMMADISETGLSQPESYEKLQQILTDKKYSKSAKVEQIRECLKIDKKDKAQNEIWKLICGLQATLATIFTKEDFSEENQKYKFSFDDGSFDEKIAEVEEMLSDGAFETVLLMKHVHDWIILEDIMKCEDGKQGTYTYLSEARIAMYEKHKKDLKVLKELYKVNAPDLYNAMFRTMEDNNYSAYVGSVNAGGKTVRRGGKRKTQDVYAKIKKEIADFPETEQKSYVLKEIEKETFLPKQLTNLNGVIPNQVHLVELKKILANAETYLKFLGKKDESGYTVSQKIIQLFRFPIPYYVGPLVNTEQNHAWVVRKEGGKVYPWNFEQKIDVKGSAEQFIYKMVNHCTYLSEEQVLPKNSLLYERFMVLNELNNLKVNGEKISAEQKQEIYQELFKTGKKVTGKKIRDWFLCKGYVSKNVPIEITGIDGDCVNRLANYKKFLEVFGVETLTDQQEKMAENIILWSTLYGDSKKFLKEKIEDEYGDQLTQEQEKRILGYKFKDWGRLSRQFLLLEGADKNTGEIQTIISRLWNENYNLMQLLGDDLFTYKEEIEKKTSRTSKLLSEIEYEDLKELYISAPVRRMTWQTILILKELTSVLGKCPDKVFVEMAREHQEDKKRTVSRKKKFEELYKKCRGEEHQWLEEIKDRGESEFRSKKLYLYYTQKGRCMYTGDRIELSDLFNDNLYDIDHIYPRHFVKDDNIDNNLVLVRKQKNGAKQDVFPVDSDIQTKQHGMWNSLLEGGFITKEKYQRLRRTTSFTEDEQAAFISRQIVETRQGTKMIADLLHATCPDSDLVYVKAGNVSEFRHKFNLIKCRTINDLHHAKDAYLNIVVGNAYDVKFTKSPKRFIEEYRRDPQHHPYHMDKLFEYDIRRGDCVAWEKEKSIAVVKQVMKRNTPLVTYRNFEAHGQIADQTLYSAKDAAKADGKGYISLKGSDERMQDTTRYGGYSSCTGTYFFAVEYTLKKKRIRVLEPVPLYLKEQLSSVDALEAYCRDELGYEEPRVICDKIKMYSLMKINGYYAYISGRTGNQVLTMNAVQLVLNYEWELYIKKLSDVVERNVEEEELEDSEVITKEKNKQLYHELMLKHRDFIYSRRPNPVGNKLAEWEERFGVLNPKEQIIVLNEILKLSQRQNQGINLKLIGEGTRVGVSAMNKKISGLYECKIINQSVTGLFTSEMDLLCL